MKDLRRMSVDGLVGEAYDIGHAHGRNTCHHDERRVGDGWGPIAEELKRRLNNRRRAKKR